MREETSEKDLAYRLDRLPVPPIPDARNLQDPSFQRFYPKYGAGAIRRSTNQYRGGDRGNKNRHTKLHRA